MFALRSGLPKSSVWLSGFSYDLLTAEAGLEYDHSIARLRKQFRFGSWAEAQKETITYCGCEISQSASFDSHVRQERFA